jgi:hypothetical protein
MGVEAEGIELFPAGQEITGNHPCQNHVGRCPDRKTYRKTFSRSGRNQVSKSMETYQPPPTAA